MNHEADRELVAAVNAGDDAGVAQALARGADPEVAVGRFRGSVLSAAAASGHVRIVRMLLEAGASASPTDPHTWSPLRLAVIEAHPDIAELLIDNGALAHEPDGRGSVLAEAVAYTQHRPQPAALAVLRLLLQRGATPADREEAALVQAVVQRATPVVLRILLDHGADPNQHRCDATPVLVLAARQGDHAAVEVLLQAGADVNAADGRGRTALMHAIERGERVVIAALRNAGADVDRVSADGMTALGLARGWQRQNIQHMLGVRQTGEDNLPITRTTIQIRPTGARLLGDPAMFLLWAQVIERALDDLGSSEWQIRTAIAADDATAFANRLRHEPQPSDRASWHTLACTSTELATVRKALVELAYGTTRVMPAGTRRIDIVDLLNDLDRQLGL